MVREQRQEEGRVQQHEGAVHEEREAADVPRSRDEERVEQVEGHDEEDPGQPVGARRDAEEHQALPQLALFLRDDLGVEVEEADHHGDEEPEGALRRRGVEVDEHAALHFGVVLRGVVVLDVHLGHAVLFAQDVVRQRVLDHPRGSQRVHRELQRRVHVVEEVLLDERLVVEQPVGLRAGHVAGDRLVRDDELGRAEDHDGAEGEAVLLLDVGEGFGDVQAGVQVDEVFLGVQAGLVGDVCDHVVDPGRLFADEHVAEGAAGGVEVALLDVAHRLDVVDARRLVLVGVARQVVDEHDHQTDQRQRQQVRDYEVPLQQRHLEVLLQQDPHLPSEACLLVALVEAQESVQVVRVLAVGHWLAFGLAISIIAILCK